MDDRSPGRWHTGRRRLARIAAILVLLMPLGLVAPLSALPNPIGLYHLTRGGYEYEPDSRFVNRFALLGSRDPRPKLESELGRLIGKTGLDPLDPVQPLSSYRIVSLLTRPRGLDLESAAATIEFRYGDGSARTYQIPVYDRILSHEGRGGWRWTGLDRPLATHEALPWLPFANGETAIGIGTPARLPVAMEAGGIASGPRWSAAYLGMGSWAAQGNALRALPGGRAILILRHDRDAPAGFLSIRVAEPTTLWLIPTDGAPPRRIDSDVRHFTTDRTGRYVTYTRWRDTRKPDMGFDVTIFDRESAMRRTVGRADVAQVAIAGGAVYFLNAGILSHANLAEGPANELFVRPDAALSPGLPAAPGLAVSPDGTRIAYRCFTDLCLIDRDGTNPARVALDYTVPTGYRSPWAHESFGVAWSADGRRLAVTTTGCCEGAYNAPYAAPTLRIIDRGGAILQRYALGPDGPLWEPRWTPDSRFVFVNAFPRGGRRIVVADTGAGRVADLSRAGWDAFFDLAPDGERLLLWNARGNFWTAPLERR